MSDAQLRQLERQSYFDTGSAVKWLQATRRIMLYTTGDLVDHPKPAYRWIVQTASAKMPSNCWGSYGRVAILELEHDWPQRRVSMISERARGCRRIIEIWERCHIGKTAGSAYWVAVAEAQKIADEHNEKAGLPI